jgi:hypothetical protein
VCVFSYSGRRPPGERTEPSTLQPPLDDNQGAEALSTMQPPLDDNQGAEALSTMQPPLDDNQGAGAGVEHDAAAPGRQPRGGNLNSFKQF